MRKVWLSVASLLLLVGSAAAQKHEEERVENAGTVLQEILNAPDSIPKNVLDKAYCVVVLPSVKKFAIGIGGSYGRGVMTCRTGSKFTGKWGAPTMMALEGASAGLQLGGEATDFVLLLMSDKSASSVLSSKVKLGGDVSAAAGPVGREASAETDVALKAEILSYSRAKGLFGGVSLEGSTLRPDDDANKDIYGKKLDAKDIVFKGVAQPPSSATKLLATLDKATPIRKS